MTLFIFDQPVPARRFAEKLGIVRDCRNCLYCKGDAAVVFTGGSLFEFQGAEDYDSRYAKWSREDLPLAIKRLVKVPVAKQKEKIQFLEDLLKKADAVVHAGSPDPDGQEAVDSLLEHCGYKGELARLWNSGGFGAENRLPAHLNSAFGNLVRVRSENSWRISENIKRALSCMLNSAGVRISISYDYSAAAALGMIVDRERQSAAAEDGFYTIRALVDGIPVWSKPVDGEKEAAALRDKVGSARGFIRSYSVCERFAPPPLPHDFTSLALEAERLYGMDVLESCAIANELYENGFISYPNVDERRLPAALFGQSRRLLSSLFGMEGAAQANPSIRSECFAELEGLPRHGIIPLECSWQKLQGKKLKIFRIIAKRYIQQFYPDKKYREQELSVDFDGEILSASGELVDVPGWADLSESSPLELPRFRKGDVIASDMVSIQKASLSRFSGGELLAAMSSAERFELDDAYRGLLAGGGRIGFGREKVKILRFLKDRQYVGMDGRQIIPTKMGKNFVSWLPASLCSPALAALEEKRIWESEWSGEVLDLEAARIDGKIGEWLSEIDRLMVKSPQKQNLVCPKCGMDIVERLSKGGSHYWQCMNQSCGRRFSDYKGRCVMPAKCPKCGKAEAERYKRKEGDGYYWFCPECKKYYDDSDGKLVPQAECPVCGEVSVQRYESRNNPGIFYWHCRNRECGKRFSDDEGKIGRKFREENEKAECPDCGGKAWRYESKTKKGEFFWRCSACEAFFTDEDGKIGHNKEKDRKQDKCPVCGGVALQFVSAKGNPYWRCKADNQHGPFGDDDGRPGAAFGEPKAGGLEEAKCPHCNGKAYKSESKNKPGTFFWRCKNCGLMSDEDGVPGKVFSAKK